MEVSNTLEKGLRTDINQYDFPMGCYTDSVNGKIVSFDEEEGLFIWQPSNGISKKFSVPNDNGTRAWQSIGNCQYRDRVYIFFVDIGSLDGNNCGDGQFGYFDDSINAYVPVYTSPWFKFNPNFLIDCFANEIYNNSVNIYFSDYYSRSYSIQNSNANNNNQIINPLRVINDNTTYYGLGVSGIVGIQTLSENLINIVPDMPYGNVDATTHLLNGGFDAVIANGGRLQAGNYFLQFRFRDVNFNPSNVSQMIGPFSITQNGITNQDFQGQYGGSDPGLVTNKRLDITIDTSVNGNYWSYIDIIVVAFIGDTKTNYLIQNIPNAVPLNGVQFNYSLLQADNANAVILDDATLNQQRFNFSPRTIVPMNKKMFTGAAKYKNYHYVEFLDIANDLVIDYDINETDVVVNGYTANYTDYATGTINETQDVCNDTQFKSYKNPIVSRNLRSSFRSDLEQLVIQFHFVDGYWSYGYPIANYRDWTVDNVPGSIKSTTYTGTPNSRITGTYQFPPNSQCNGGFGGTNDPNYKPVYYYNKGSNTLTLRDQSHSWGEPIYLNGGSGATSIQARVMHPVFRSKAQYLGGSNEFHRLVTQLFDYGIIQGYSICKASQVRNGYYNGLMYNMAQYAGLNDTYHPVGQSSVFTNLLQYSPATLFDTMMFAFTPGSPPSGSNTDATLSQFYDDVNKSKIFPLGNNGVGKSVFFSPDYYLAKFVNSIPYNTQVVIKSEHPLEYNRSLITHPYSWQEIDHWKRITSINDVGSDFWTFLVGEGYDGNTKGGALGTSNRTGYLLETNFIPQWSDTDYGFYIRNPTVCYLTSTIFPYQDFTALNDDITNNVLRSWLGALNPSDQTTYPFKVFTPPYLYLNVGYDDPTSKDAFGQLFFIVSLFKKDPLTFQDIDKRNWYTDPSLNNFFQTGHYKYCGVRDNTQLFSYSSGQFIPNSDVTQIDMAIEDCYNGDAFINRTSIKNIYGGFTDNLYQGWNGGDGIHWLNPPTNTIPDPAYFTGDGTPVNYQAFGSVLSFICESAVNVCLRNELLGRKGSNSPDIADMLLDYPFNGDLTGYEALGYNNAYSQNNSGFFVKGYPSILPEIVTRFPVRINYSDVFNFSSIQDAFRNFNPGNYKDYDITNGELIKLIVLKKNLYGLQEKALDHFIVDEKYSVPNQPDTIIQLAQGPALDEIYDEVQCRVAFAQTEEGFYWIDFRQLSVCKFDGSKLVSVSLEKFCKSFIVKIITDTGLYSGFNIQQFDLDNICFGSYYKKNNEIIFSFRSLRTETYYTITFNEALDEFTGQYTYFPTAFIPLKEDLYLENDPTTNNIYLYDDPNYILPQYWIDDPLNLPTPQISAFEIVVKSGNYDQYGKFSPNPKLISVYDYINIVSNKPRPSSIVFNTANQTGTIDFVSNPNYLSRYLEKLWRMKTPRESTKQQRLRDNFLKIRFIYNNINIVNTTIKLRVKEIVTSIRTSLQ